MSSDSAIVVQSTCSTEGENNTCRICLSTADPNDKFISPCKCKGSIQMIHSSCFKDYLLSKTGKGASGLVCELCGFNYKIKLSLQRSFSFRKLFQKEFNSVIIATAIGFFNTLITAALEGVLLSVGNTDLKNPSHYSFDTITRWVAYVFVGALMVFWLFSTGSLLKELREHGLVVRKAELKVCSTNEVINVSLDDLWEGDGDDEEKSKKYFGDLLENDEDNYPHSIWRTRDCIVVDIAGEETRDETDPDEVDQPEGGVSVEVC